MPDKKSQSRMIEFPEGTQFQSCEFCRIVRPIENQPEICQCEKSKKFHGLMKNKIFREEADLKYKLMKALEYLDLELKTIQKRGAESRWEEIFMRVIQDVELAYLYFAKRTKVN